MRTSIGLFKPKTFWPTFSGRVIFGLFLGGFLLSELFAFPSWGKGKCWLTEDRASAVQDMPPQERLQQRMRENILTLRLLRMTRALDLTEEQAAKIFPVANRVEREKMQLNRQLGQEIRELRSLLAISSPEEAKIKEKIQKVNELREAIRAKESEFETFLVNNLTVIQRGRYVLFNFDFAQFLGQNLEKVRAMQRNKPQPLKKSP